MKPDRIFLTSIITACILFTANSNAASPVFNIQLGVAAEDFEGKTDSYNQLTGSVHYAKGLNRNSVINLNADLFTRKFNEDDNRDSNGVLGELIVSYIPTSGYTKPMYSLALRHERANSDNFENDYSKTSLILADTIRLDEQLTLTAGIDLINQSFQHDDRTLVGVFINMDFQTSKNLIAYLNFRFQDEQSKSTTLPDSTSSRVANRIDYAGGHLATETPHVVDPALPTSNSISVGPDSKNSTFIVGANYTFNSNNTIDLSYEWVRYDFTETNDIEASIISLDYFYKF